jgi:hypothetical protein
MPWIGRVEDSFEYLHGNLDPPPELVVVLGLLYGDGTVPAVES